MYELTRNEELVLVSIWKLKDNASGVTIRERFDTYLSTNKPFPRAEARGISRIHTERRFDPDSKIGVWRRERIKDR